jgi:FAD/FMN-containing dehydrogenase
MSLCFIEKLSPGCVLPKYLWENHLQDWRKKYKGSAAYIFAPSSTTELQMIVREASNHKASIVIQGGNTGNCGGAIPQESGQEWLILMHRINQIRKVSARQNTITVDAGVTLFEIQEAASKINRFFPLSLGSEHQCQIGGNLSTNAGGNNALRYGTMRQLCLGLEVILADGQVWSNLSELHKNTAGFDLKHYFIGAEGQLGIITGACLKLFPKPAYISCLWISCDTLSKAIQTLNQCKEYFGDHIRTFEIMHEYCMSVVSKRPPSLAPWMILCEIEFFLESSPLSIETTLINHLKDLDIIIARNEHEREIFWHIRESIPLNQPKNIKHDIALPIDQLESFVLECSKDLKQNFPGIEIFIFGHLGDGNLHFNTCFDHAYEQEIHRVVYDHVIQRQGTISAEHGIGRLKREDFEYYADPIQLDIMKRIKNIFDPYHLFQRNVYKKS